LCIADLSLVDLWCPAGEGSVGYDMASMSEDINNPLSPSMGEDDLGMMGDALDVKDEDL
jgi:hypothetical protein